jgi:hypothetical protein
LTTTLLHDLQRLQKEIEDRNVAINIVDAELRIETRRASNLLLEAVQAETTRLGTNFAKAFVALRQAHLDFNKHVDDLDATGANVESLRLYPNGLSDPTDLSGNYPWGLREFADHGFLPKSQAPKMI